MDLRRLLAVQGFGDAAEQPLRNDGWSGSRLTTVEHGGRRAVLKRTSAELDWIVRATDDHALREAWVAEGPLDLPPGLAAPYHGVAREGSAAVLLMPDLGDELLTWSDGTPPIAAEVLDRVLHRLAALHAARWWPESPAPPWCPLDRRLLLLTRPAAARYAAEGNPVGERFLAGWDAFERRAPVAARDLVGRLSDDPTPLIGALGRLPAVGLHGDLKLANVALLGADRIALIDWQMTLRAPVAVELGWLLVSNVALLPEPPDELLTRYRAAAADEVAGDWDEQVGLACIVGLLLRAWRKGLDAEAEVATGWGTSGWDDLAWWCERAVNAADRWL
jgi:hypothetical protein